MKRLIFSLMTFFALSNGTYSQDIGTDNHQLYGGLGSDLFTDVITYNEGAEQFVLAVGRTTNGSELNENYQGGTNDLVISKFDLSNNLIWSKNYGGSDVDVANAVVQTTDGGFLVVGSTRSSDGDVSENAAPFTQDVWVLKVDVSGELQWEQTFGGILEEVAMDIIATSDGNYIIGSAAQSGTGDNTVSQGNYDFWLIKIDGDGQVIWRELYGGNDSEAIESLIEAEDESIIAVGPTRTSGNGDVSENYGLNDFWVVKTDNLGQLIWEHNFGGSGQDRAYEVKADDEGNYLIFGSTESDDNDISSLFGGTDMWLIKIDPFGNLIWERNYGGTDGDIGYDFSLAPVGSGNMVLVGTTSSTDNDFEQNLGGSDGAVIWVDSDGNLLESFLSGGSEEDITYAIGALADFEFVSVGTSRSGDGDLANFEPFGNRDNWIFNIGISPLSTEERDSHSRIQVYPNPANGSFRIEAPAGIDRLEVLSAEGKRIHKLKLVPGVSNLDLSLDQGLYLLNFSGFTGNETHRLVIE